MECSEGTGSISDLYRSRCLFRMGSRYHCAAFYGAMPPEAIAEKMRHQKERIEEVIAYAGDKLKDPQPMETYRHGLAWRVTRELEKAYIAGYRKGYSHAIKGMEEKSGRSWKCLHKSLF